MCCVGVLGNKQHWRKQGNWFWHVHVHSYLLSYFAVHCWIVWLLCSVKTFLAREHSASFSIFLTLESKFFCFCFFSGLKSWFCLLHTGVFVLIIALESLFWLLLWSRCSVYCFGVFVLIIALESLFCLSLAGVRFCLPHAGVMVYIKPESQSCLSHIGVTLMFIASGVMAVLNKSVCQITRDVFEQQTKEIDCELCLKAKNVSYISSSQLCMS